LGKKRCDRKSWAKQLLRKVGQKALRQKKLGKTTFKKSWAKSVATEKVGQKL
jgi:hypothetical protein